MLPKPIRRSIYYVVVAILVAPVSFGMLCAVIVDTVDFWSCE